MVVDVVTAPRSSDVLQIPLAPSALRPERPWHEAPLLPLLVSQDPLPVACAPHRCDTSLLFLLRCRHLSCLSS